MLPTRSPARSPPIIAACNPLRQPTKGALSPPPDNYLARGILFALLLGHAQARHAQPFALRPHCDGRHRDTASKSPGGCGSAQAAHCASAGTNGARFALLAGMIFASMAAN